MSFSAPLLQKWLLLVATLLLGGACATAAPSSPQTSADPPAPDVAATLRQVMETPELEHALWAILIEEDDGRVIIDINSRKLMMPGSGRKLFTAAFVTACLPLISSIQTVASLDGRIEGEVFEGDLILTGHGDPALGGRYDSHRDRPLLPIVDALTALGVRRISGRVIGDVSRFSGPEIPPSWKVGNLRDSYAAPVAALAYNENVVGISNGAPDCPSMGWTTDPSFVPVNNGVRCGETSAPSLRISEGNILVASGTVASGATSRSFSDLLAIRSPGLYAAQALHDLLNRKGIAVDHQPEVTREPRGGAKMLIVIDSPPLPLLLSTVLKNSQNLYAEMLLRAAASTGTATSLEQALILEERFVSEEAGIDPREIDFADGSGLSPENMVTPRALVQLLRYLSSGTRGAVYRQLLATPGEEGTLRRRFAGLESRLRGKTGTINGVNTLSGYVEGKEGGRRYFSIFLNHHTTTSSVANGAIDAIVRAVAAF